MRRFTDATGTSPAVLFTPLEPRQLLAQAGPLPDIAELENPANPVARLVTRFGIVDLELFQDTNPRTVNNFISYVELGSFDYLFFHDLVPGFTLRGGGYTFTDARGLAPAFIAETGDEFMRSNDERTVAMVDDFNGAALQFNLADNSEAFDPLERTVFARVVGDASWAVVAAIAALPVVDMRGDPSWQSPHTEQMDAVPGGPTPGEDMLAMVWDVEIIKPGDTTEFYDEFVHYPEGFAGSSISEFLPIANPNDAPVYYQVIARSEHPRSERFGDDDVWFRDKVIASGRIEPRTRDGIEVSRVGPGGLASGDLVIWDVPYALEIRSTLLLAANFSHYDFGSATGESLVADTAERWTFPDVYRLFGVSRDFLVWYNPGQEAADVSITFYLDDGSTRSTSVRTEGYRRGGLDVNSLTSIPSDTRFSVVIEADREIVAAQTRYAVWDGLDRTGFTTLGLAGDGSTRGVLPMANAGASAEQLVTFFNPSATESAAITLVFSYGDGSDEFIVAPAGLHLGPRGRSTFNIADIPEANDGRRFTLRYDSDDVPVFAHAFNEQFEDTVSYPMGVRAATRWDYAEGFTDPARAGTDVFETLSLFNPNFGGIGRADVVANVQVRFYFTGGAMVLEDRAILPGGRLDLDIDTLPSIINHINATQDFFYSIEVTSNAPMVSQFWHHDLTLGSLQPSGGFGELGAPGGDIVRLG